MALVQKTKEQLIIEKKARRANNLYLCGMHWVKDGEALLRKGLHEKRIGDFGAARTSMSGALMQFSEGIERYEAALKVAPTQKMVKKLWRKMEGLQKCDMKCAKNALRHMRLKVETIFDAHTSPDMHGLI